MAPLYLRRAIYISVSDFERFSLADSASSIQILTRVSSGAPNEFFLDFPITYKSLHLTPDRETIGKYTRGMIGAPGTTPRPVMPGVWRTRGTSRRRDARGGPDPPPCAGYCTAYIGRSNAASSDPDAPTRRGDVHSHPGWCYEQTLAGHLVRHWRLLWTPNSRPVSL